MKQLIVLVATIVLGVVIAGMVLNFRVQATDIGATASRGLNNAATSFAAILP